jgi:hypothetical protein
MTDSNAQSEQAERESAVLLRRRAQGVTELVMNRPDKRHAFDDVNSGLRRCRWPGSLLRHCYRNGKIQFLPE